MKDATSVQQGTNRRKTNGLGQIWQIALSQDKSRTTETGLNYRQGEAVVSTDLLSRAEVMAEFVDANSDQSYKAWKKLELQQWLKNHGLKVSGTKEELVARVENAKRAGVETVVERAARENKEITKRAAEKLSTPTETLPDPKNLKSWTKDLSRLPRLTSKDTMNYLVFGSCKFYKNEDMQCFKQLKAYKFFKDGHVQDSELAFINDRSSYCFVRAKVLPSMKTDRVYNTWISLVKDTANVFSADCNCIAGLGEACNHIAALLFAIEDYAKVTNEGKMSCTSLPCEWNKPRKRKLSPKRVSNLQPVKHKYGKKPRLAATPKPGLYKAGAPVSNSFLPNFLDNLQSVNPDCIIFTVTERQNVVSCDGAIACDDNIRAHEEVVTSEFDVEEFAKHYEPQKFPPRNLELLSDILNFASDEFQEKRNNYFASLRMSKVEAELIEISTRGQSVNPKWLKARKGRITASQFGRICKMRPTTPPDNVVREIMGYKQESNGPLCSKAAPLQWGSQHESVARERYVKFMKKKGHKRLTVMERGLVVQSGLPYLGASPGGFVYCPCCREYQRLLEIKCPYKWRLLTPRVAAQDKKFFCHINSKGKVKLKKTSIYYYQIQGLMTLCKLKICDFVIWTLKGLLVIRVKFDETFWKKKMLPKLVAFFKVAIVTEVLTERVRRGIPLTK